MRKFFYDNRINFLFLFISFICLASVVGIENIPFQNTKWLHNGADSGTIQLGWYFFLNDIWRFPLGNNPNYGDGLSVSIVFSDSIPILALFFKLFKSFISTNFQYFSFWYLICFYLQLFFSFKILKEFTNSTSYSLVGSIFFLIAPIFIFRMNWHQAEAGMWLLLCALYLVFFNKIDKSKLSWFFLIILSLLISYNFTIPILVTYSFFRIFNFFAKKENFLKLTKDFLIIGVLLLLTLYILGVFQLRLGDTMGVGFGAYKLNLLSVFDPVNSVNSISWSWFLPDIKLSIEEELEGFNYLGLGQIMMSLFALFLFLNRKNKAILFSIKDNKEIKVFVLVSLFLTLWALSNKISFGPFTLIEIPLNKYIFGALSIFKSSGRAFWIVNYFLLIMSLVIIFKCFNKRNSLLIISLFLIIQVADTSAGIKQRINFFTPMDKSFGVKDQIWEDLFKKYKVVKTTYPVNYSQLLSRFTYSIEKNNIEKTNLVAFGRINRKAFAEAKYNLYDNFRKKNLASDTVYVVDNLGHLLHLKYLLKNENIGFFYRDNIWAMVTNEKERMHDNDKQMFNEIGPKLLEINQINNLSFKNENNYYGFGWSHNQGKPGIWSEGPMSTLFFKANKNHGDLKLEIICKPYITKKSNILEFDIYVNNTFNQNLKLAKNNQDEKLEVLIKEEFIDNNEIKIDFKFKNLVSPYEVLESPDSRKLGILVKNIKIIPKNMM